MARTLGTAFLHNQGFYALVEDVLGPERRSMAYTLLGQFMEEGRIHRVTTGLYRLNRQPLSPEEQDS